MIQPIKQFRVTRLTMSGFKGYSEPQTFRFGNMNVISGHMGVGKSSIADAIAFAITGVSFYAGAKIDYLYHQNTRDLLVELEFETEDGKTRTLSRRRKNDNMDITLDGIHVTQRDLTVMFGERDLFLSMFNPQYFINVLGAKGRDLLERYLPEIPKEEVLSQLGEDTRALLEQQTFLSAEGCAKQLRGQVAALENDLVYLQGQIDLRREQQEKQSEDLAGMQAELARLQEHVRDLETKRTTGHHGADLEETRAELYARYEELNREAPEIADTDTLDAQIQAAGEKLAQRRADVYQSQYAKQFSETQAKVNSLGAEFRRLRHIHDGLTPGVQCPVCRQTVTEQTLPQVKREFAGCLRRIQTEGRQLTVQLKELQELDAKAHAVFDQFQQDDIAAGEAALAELKAQRAKAVELAQIQREQRRQELERLHREIQSIELDLECGMLSQEESEDLQQSRDRLAQLTSQVEMLTGQLRDGPASVEQQAQKLAAMKEDIRAKREIITALAFYISKRVELNFAKLKMNRVAISLYDVVKTTGEVKDVFRFTYEGRDYICLSRSEKIRAGLEVAELIKRLLGVQYPTFIDDVESVPIIDNVRPTGQVFIAKVVKGAALQVQVADAAAPAKAA